MSYHYKNVIKSSKLFLIGLLLLGSGLVFGDGGAVQAAQNLAVALQQITGAPPKSVPGAMNYQGVLRDNQGNVIKSGEYTLTFNVYDVESGGQPLYTEKQTGVIVRDGRFGVTLGYAAPLPAKLFTAGKDRFVGVTVDPYQEMLPRQRLGSVPYAFRAEAAANGVPVGTVIDWWRPDANFPLPDGYLVCAGQVVQDTESPLNGKNLPNLTNKFVLGVTDPNQIGITGGAPNHIHAFDIPPVTVKTSPNGGHNHQWGGDNGNDFLTFNQSGAPIIGQFWTNKGIADDGGGYHLAGLVHVSNGVGYTNMAPDHQHDVTVDVPAVNLTATPNLPPYTQLLKLCRVK